MSFKPIVSISFLVLALGIIIQSCSHYDMAKNNGVISKNGENESHNNGKNCMSCHSSSGSGEGWFNIAGSVYKTNQSTQNPNGKILLYTLPNGQGDLKYTIEVDAKGNFYTTEIINFGTGLYPVHQNTQGTLKYMGTSINTGQCQSCHNVSTDNIWNE